jgi:hypothetical protein
MVEGEAVRWTLHVTLTSCHHHSAWQRMSSTNVMFGVIKGWGDVHKHRQGGRCGNELHAKAKKRGSRGWECLILSEVMEERASHPEEIERGGHISQDLPHIHVSGEVAGREESIRFHHSPLNY